jgi:hypothetical protein
MQQSPAEVHRFEHDAMIRRVDDGMLHCLRAELIPVGQVAAGYMRGCFEALSTG